MPIIDMPLEELKTYQGRNPRPSNFDPYWETGLAEMRSIDPQIELVPVETGASYAELFHLYFTGVGGARIHAKYSRPKNASEPHPAVVVFHGYGGNSGDWFGHLPWVGQGFSVAALDCRGQGGLSEDAGEVKGNTFRGQIIRGLDDCPEKLLFRSIFLDCAQLAGIIMDMPEVDAGRVGVTGGSQGGGLTLACASLEPRIKRAAPVIPFLCDYKRVWEMDLAKDAYNELSTYFRLFDPRHEREDEVFTKLGYIDNQYLAAYIRAEVLMFTGLMDTICPPSTQFAAYNKITSKKNMVIYPDFGHEPMPDKDDRVFEFMCGL
ncbi:MAG: acetylxylan esterase [Armatimonadetes bacterium]|nr:acetylxylan esterase [Armatimonadota bacterium]